MNNNCPAPKLSEDLAPIARAPRGTRAGVLAGFRAQGAVDRHTAQTRSNAFFGIIRRLA